ncbi:MAG: Gp49 family protein [Cetobacterium sp.]
MEYIKRMEIELTELKDKIDKGQSFLNKEKQKPVFTDERQRELLESQLWYMNMYYNSLKERIKYDSNIINQNYKANEVNKPIRQVLQVSLIEFKENGSADVLGCKEYCIHDNKIPNELVKSFIVEEQVTTERVFGKLNTVLKYNLLNGFTGVESTSCVDEKNYSEEIGRDILRKRIEEKIWYGLGFALGMAKNEVVDIKHNFLKEKVKEFVTK